MSKSKSPPLDGNPPATATPPGAPGKGRAKKRAPAPFRDVQRKGLTPKLARFLRNAQMDALGIPRCGCGCGDKLERDAIGEHWHTVALGNKKRPDCLVNRGHAKIKTYGGQDGAVWRAVGGDTRDIKHTRKLAEGRTQHDRRLKYGAKLKGNRKLPKGPGFRKDIRRTMNGTVGPRSR